MPAAHGSSGEPSSAERPRSDLVPGMGRYVVGPGFRKGLTLQTKKNDDPFLLAELWCILPC